jgi:hypothetical protein
MEQIQLLLVLPMVTQEVLTADCLVFLKVQTQIMVFMDWQVLEASQPITTMA